MEDFKSHTAPESLNIVNEALGVYIRNLQKSNIVNVGVHGITLSDFFDHKLLVIRTIRKGISYSLFRAIQSIAPFSEAEWAEFMNISTKTLQRNQKEKDFVFKPIHTEKILELAEVTNFGREVFDSTDHFYTWLNAPSYALGNMKPAELLKDSYGKEMVMAELTRIEYGIFA